MRRLTLAFAVAMLVATTGLFATAAPTAAASNAKVVIVVGAVGSNTAGWINGANQAADTFAQYTSNVTKIYSPNATWAAVKAAAVGANILVYIGHGSGFPNPYVGYLQPNGDNGMGLNATAGNGDSNTQYYGENYMAQLGLAPNALVILNHLCYASGNNEAGLTNPTLKLRGANDLTVTNRLTVTVSAPSGWSYFLLPNPADTNQFALQHVLRQDGSEIAFATRQFLHALGSFGDDRAHDPGHGQARTAPERVGDVRTEGVAALEHRGDASLGPVGAGIVGALLGHHQHVAEPRRLQGEHHARQLAARRDRVDELHFGHLERGLVVKCRDLVVGRSVEHDHKSPLRVGHIIHYANSGDISGDKSRVVGYISAAFTR